jgi:membrane dipeptidase
VDRDPREELPRAALELHGSLVVIDGHCDSVGELLPSTVSDSRGRAAGPLPGSQQPKPPRDFLARGGGQVDLPRLLEGGVSCQFMALFVDEPYLSDPAGRTLELLEALESVFARTRDFRPALSARDILSAKAEGAASALITIEGGEAIGESLDSLRAFYARGVRLMGLTWNRRNALGRGAGSGRPAVDGSGGLTDFGRSVVAEMETLGMIVDASHLSDEALDDLLAIARRPLVASHSNARALCPHWRNLSDAQARAIAATGGLVAATFAGMFVHPVPARVGVGSFLDHVDHLLAVVGEDHVGIGSDFDGCPEAFGLVLSDCSQMGRLTAGLLERGHSPDAVGKIMGGNWLRVIAEILG